MGKQNDVDKRRYSRALDLVQDYIEDEPGLLSELEGVTDDEDSRLFVLTLISTTAVAVRLLAEAQRTDRETALERLRSHINEAMLTKNERRAREAKRGPLTT